MRNVSFDLHSNKTASVARSAAGIVGLLVALGCGGTATELDSLKSSGELEGDNPIGAASQPLTLAGDPSSPVAWDGAKSLGTVTGATGTPAVTSGCVASFAAFTRVSPSGRYKGAADGDTGVSAWATYSTRSFASSPSITALPTPNCDGLRLMVAGRGAGIGANSRIYWSNGRVTRAANAVFNPPVAETGFVQVSSRQFTGDNGYPAVTSSPEGDAYLAFRSGSRVYAHTKAASSGSWGPEDQAPALPAGWQPVGTPAIEYGFFWGPVTLVVRAQNGSGQTAFFAILYNQGSFRPSWIELGAPPSGSPPVESDPALEWNDWVFTHTLYYRSGGSFYQASFFLDEWAHSDIPAKQIIHAHIQPAYESAPSANGNIDIEQERRHWVVGRSGSELFFAANNDSDSELAP